MNPRPASLLGLHHVALFSVEYEATRSFYVDLLGMDIDWEPDSDNVYLTSGTDNVAIHRATTQLSESGQRLDHIGFILKNVDDVDAWHDYLVGENVAIIAEPKTHRDGSRSFYCADPSGTVVQMLFHPTLSVGTLSSAEPSRS